MRFEDLQRWVSEKAKPNLSRDEGGVVAGRAAAPSVGVAGQISFTELSAMDREPLLCDPIY